MENEPWEARVRKRVPKRRDGNFFEKLKEKLFKKFSLRHTLNEDVEVIAGRSKVIIYFY